MRKEKGKSIFMVIVVALLICTMIVPAIATTTVQDIRVTLGGIKVYVDGNIQTPVDGNGNKVEPLIYNGTTYLPVRAVTNMLTDKEVNWDQESMSIYIGKQPTAESTPIDQLLLTYSSNGERALSDAYLTGKNAQFKVLDEIIAPFNKSKYLETTNMLKSNYSSINGKFMVSYTTIGSTTSTKLEFYSVDAYGNETLLKSYEAKAGDKPIDINVNTLGVEILKVKVSNIYGEFYNVTLSGL